MMPSEYLELDSVVVGAGVVGLAVARSLQLAGRETFLIERNASFGMETSSRNSEVIHAGIYYPHGSLKADLCVRGKALLYAYCAANDVPHKKIGKIIVATDENEVEALRGYEAAAKRNGVTDLTWLSKEQVGALEPSVQAHCALHSPSTGIIDSHAYMQSLLNDFEMAGGHFIRGAEIVGGEVGANGIVIKDSEGQYYRAKHLVNSCGIVAPRFVRTITGFPEEHIPEEHYAKGHYFVLSGRSSFGRLVYPVAVQGGLGTHLTLDMNGSARFGPDVSWIESVDYEFDESRKADFVASIRRYYPEIDENLLVPGYTGIRPKISGSGALAADFLIQGEDVHGISGFVNLFGIESPGLTSSLAIGEEVLSKLGLDPELIK